MHAVSAFVPHLYICVRLGSVFVLHLDMRIRPASLLVPHLHICIRFASVFVPHLYSSSIYFCPASGVFLEGLLGYDGTTHL